MLLVTTQNFVGREELIDEMIVILQKELPGNAEAISAPSTIAALVSPSARTVPAAAEQSPTKPIKTFESSLIQAVNTTQPTGATPPFILGAVITDSNPTDAAAASTAVPAGATSPFVFGAAVSDPTSTVESTYLEELSVNQLTTDALAPTRVASEFTIKRAFSTTFAPDSTESTGSEQLPAASKSAVAAADGNQGHRIIVKSELLQKEPVQSPERVTPAFSFGALSVTPLASITNGPFSAAAPFTFVHPLRSGVSLCLVGPAGAGKTAALAKLATELMAWQQSMSPVALGDVYDTDVATDVAATLRTRPIILLRCGESKATKSAVSLQRLCCSRILEAVNQHPVQEPTSHPTGQPTAEVSGWSVQSDIAVSEAAPGDPLEIFRSLMRKHAVVLLLDGVDRLQAGEAGSDTSTHKNSSSVSWIRPRASQLLFLRDLRLHPLSRVVVSVTAFNSAGLSVSITYLRDRHRLCVSS